MDHQRATSYNPGKKRRRSGSDSNSDNPQMKKGPFASDELNRHFQMFRNQETTAASSSDQATSITDVSTHQQLELSIRPKYTKADSEKITAFDHLFQEAWAPERDQYPPDHLSHPLSYEELREYPLNDLRKMKYVIDKLPPSKINDHLTALDAELKHIHSERDKLSYDSKFSWEEQKERDLKHSQLSDSEATVNRKKVLLLDILDKKRQRGELSPEDCGAHYDQERKANLLHQQRNKVREMERRHEKAREEAWKIGVKEDLFSDINELPRSKLTGYQPSRTAKAALSFAQQAAGH